MTESAKGNRGITKAEAVRQALKALGREAKNIDIQEFIRREFGLEMTINNISAYKSMENKRIGGASGVKVRNGKGVNKMDAVRRALAELGNHAMPLEIRSFLGRQGLKIGTGLISNYKSTILRKNAAQGSVSRRPAPSAAASTELSTEDIRLLKELVERLGPEQLHELADILGA
jgi:hypothetical protein